MSRVPSLLLSAGFFSQVPMPPLTEVTPDDARRALRWMPVLGALVGLVGGLVGVGVGWASGSGLLAAAAVLASTQLILGGIHLDGLADTFDGLAALGSRKQGRDAARALEIMKAPDVGAMGVMALVILLITDVAALGELGLSPWWLLVSAVLGPTVGRTVVLTASRVGVPSARPGGFGSLFADTTPVGVAVAGNLLVAGLAGGLGWWLAGPAGCWLGAGVLVVEGFGAWWCRRISSRIGGVTGDVFGALIEVCCALTWVAATVVEHAVG